MKLPRLQLRLSSAMLGVALFCVSLAWWVDRTREPEIYYLHLYSTQVRPLSDIYNPKSSSGTFGEPVRIASLSITPGVPFKAQIPSNYDPTIDLEGTLHRRGEQFYGRVYFFIQSPMTAFDYEHTAPIKVEETNPFWEDYHFVVSTSANAY